MMRMDFSVLNRKIDRNSPVPLYHQLKQLLMEEISSGELKPDTLLPPEMEICRMLNFSRPTVRQALNAMVLEGYLVRKKGKGTFVSRPKLEANFIQKLESFHQEMSHLGMTPSTEVLRLEIVPGIPGYNERLNLNDNEDLVLLERLCASHTVANLLKIARSQAICLVENVAYDQLGVPVEYNLSRYRGDRNKFTMDMHVEDIPIEP